MALTFVEVFIISRISYGNEANLLFPETSMVVTSVNDVMLGNFANCIPPQESERTLRVAQKVERNKPFPKCACGTEHVHPSPCSSIHAWYCTEPRITVEVKSITPKHVKAATARRCRVRPPNARRRELSTAVPREFLLRALVLSC